MLKSIVNLSKDFMYPLQDFKEKHLNKIWFDLKIIQPIETT